MKQRRDTFKPQILWITCAIVVVIAIVTFLAISYFKNPAEEAAAPIQKTILANNATLKCSESDSGLGPDNHTPGYSAYFETTIDRPQVEALLHKIGEENGYNIRQAKEGELPVSSPEINNWYFDYSSKKGTSPFVQDGPVKLSFILFDSGKYVNCQIPTTRNEASLKNDAHHVLIKLDVQLPRRK